VATALSGAQIRTRVRRQLRGRQPTANLVGAVLAAVSGALTSANIHGESGFGLVDVVTFVVYFGIAGPIGWWAQEHTVRRATRWLDEDRPPTRDECRATIAVPLKAALVDMGGWTGAAATWTVLTIILGDSAGYTVRVALSILLGGLTTSGLDYFLVERVMQPVVARALAVDPPQRVIGPGVRTKLMLAWMVGSDVFLLMIGLTFLGRPSDQPPSPAAVWFIIGAGLVAGTLVVFVAGRILIDPLVELRRSVGRVQHGDLDVQLAVNDGGELGLVQAGFNQMVDGLRERRTLHDLFGRHVGEDVAREALAGGQIQLGGQRRDAAVIFVDVIGSTRLAQSRPPEEVVGLLNRFFATVVRTVAEEGGWVNKFEGDGALCVFGAPVAADDCAARALRAARTLRSELLALAAENPELDAAIGVSAGTVVAGNVGAEQRYEYTVIGSPVNEAARLTDAAKRRLGRVLAGEDAIRRGGDEAAAWSVADEIQLRGYDEPTLAFEPRPAASVTEPKREPSRR
jgi:adenylate cyclase